MNLHSAQLLMIKNTFRYLYNFFLYLFCFIILLSTVIITLIRLALPQINQQQEQIQKWINHYTNIPMKVARVDASWDGWLPHLQLTQTSIFDAELNDKIVSFNSATIQIDILKSLYNNEIIPKSITLSGLDVTLLYKQDGSVSISEYSPGHLLDQQRGNKKLGLWLLAQNNLQVEQASITLSDTDHKETPLLLSDVTLNINNNGYRTRINGGANLPNSYGKKLDFTMDFKGDILNKNWGGTIYFESNNINISPLLEKIDGIDIDKYEGTISTKLWSSWNQAKLRKLEGQIELSKIKLQNNQSEFYIDSMSGNFLAIRTVDKGFDLSLNLKQLITKQATWPEFTMSLNKIYDNKSGQYKYLLSASYLNINDLVSLLNIYPNSPSDKLSLINDLEPTGHLKNSLFKYDPTLDNAEKFYIDAEFSELGLQHYDSAVTVKGLSGHVKGTSHGSLHIRSNETEIHSLNFFDQPLTLYELNSKLNWKFHHGDLLANIHMLNTHTEDFNLQLIGTLEFRKDKELPFINILLDTQNLELNRVSHYFPKHMPEAVHTALTELLAGGEISSAKFIFRGWLEDYPFNNNEGNFKGLVEINQATLNYHPEWPAIEESDLNVLVDNDRLTININSGKFFEADINGPITIENIATADTEKVISVDIQAKGRLEKGLLFIANSPLQKQTALQELLTQEITGDLNLELRLDIPLSPTPNSVDGLLFLDKAFIHTKQLDMQITDVTGVVHFTSDLVSADNIEGQYFAQPVLLSIKSDGDLSNEIIMTGTADNQFISDQLSHYFPAVRPWKSEIEKHISGSSSWQATMTNSYADNGGTNKKITIESTLEGLTVDLLSSLPKSPGIVPFALSVIFPQEDKYEINIQYADIINATMTDEHLSVHGDIDKLNASEWFGFILPKLNTEEITGRANISMQLQVETLDFLGQELPDVNLKLNSIDSGYHVKINAEHVAGDIYIAETLDKEPVTVKLQKLHLINNGSENKPTTETHPISPATIPPLEMEITNFSYKHIDSGQMKLSISKVNNGLSIDHINFHNQDITIDGNGLWSIADKEQHSVFKLKFQATSVENLSKIFDYNESPIKNSKTDLNVDVQWHDSPQNFSFNNLNGTLNINLTEGQLLDIEPKVGRLFGLLSLQALPKRLFLDFSDLIGVGLAFDYIKGDFNIENGNAHTNNLSMSGSSVDINISGNTDLVKQNYDQVVTVTPKVSSGLPTIGALFGPVGIGIGLAMSISGGFDNLLSAQYTIIGSWDDPEVIKINQIRENP